MVGNDILKRLTLNFDTSKALQGPQMNITRRAKLPIIYNHNTILSGNVADTFPSFLNAKKDQLPKREQGDPNIDNHKPNPCTGPSTFFPLRFESWPRTWRSRQGQGGGRDVLERSCQVLQNWSKSTFAQLCSLASVVAVSGQYCTVEEYVDAKYDLHIFKLGNRYRAMM